ncbi:MAG: D-glycero-beta-D-manno-heptose 1-phosphate adenylyltransferase [Saprospiraceae bacterium]|nr:D-glycero-beta-D-manno-heptose 1-phosphate adenylyltransferase [Saprospiraceae bacterium]
MKYAYHQKILTIQDLLTRADDWKNQEAVIVFTNGCFDILHLGHVDYLQQAASLGDFLVVGLNSQASVSRLKGPNRPIQDEKSRAAVLASLASVDAVCIFEEDSPERLIHQLSPDILVKGGDWKPEDILGSDWVTSQGGKVMSIPFVEGYSTTRLEQKIRDQR